MPRAYGWYVFPLKHSLCLRSGAHPQDGESSAEAVAGMIVADMQGKEWRVPDWLPRHFLTEDRVCKD